MLHDEISELRVKIDNLTISNNHCYNITNLTSITYTNQVNLRRLEIDFLCLKDTVNRLIENKSAEKSKAKRHTRSFKKLRHTVYENERQFRDLVSNINEITDTTLLFFKRHNQRLRELEFSVDTLTNQFNNLTI